MHAHTNAYMHLYLHMHAHICTHAHAHVSAYTCTCVSCMHYTRLRMHIRVNVRMYACINMRTRRACRQVFTRVHAWMGTNMYLHTNACLRKITYKTMQDGEVLSAYKAADTAIILSSTRTTCFIHRIHAQITILSKPGFCFYLMLGRTACKLL